jgi:cell division protein FtsI (penicillin-binding protein 3)
VVIRNKPFAPVFLGAKVAGPVFKQVSDQLFALYTHKAPIQENWPSADSTQMHCAGNATDLSTLFKDLGRSVSLSDTPGAWVTGSTRAVAPSRDTGKNAKVISAPGAGWNFIAVGGAQAGAVPSVQGLGLRDALDVLEHKGLKVSTHGKGRVLAQSIPAGTAIKKGQTIYLQLG